MPGDRPLSASTTRRKKSRRRLSNVSVVRHQDDGEGSNSDQERERETFLSPPYRRLPRHRSISPVQSPSPQSSGSSSSVSSNSSSALLSPPTTMELKQFVASTSVSASELLKRLKLADEDDSRNLLSTEQATVPHESEQQEPILASSQTSEGKGYTLDHVTRSLFLPPTPSTPAPPARQHGNRAKIRKQRLRSASMPVNPHGLPDATSSRASNLSNCGQFECNFCHVNIFKQRLCPTCRGKISHKQLQLQKKRSYAKYLRKEAKQLLDMCAKPVCRHDRDAALKTNLLQLQLRNEKLITIHRAQRQDLDCEKVKLQNARKELHMRGVALLKAIEESSRKRQQLATTIAAADSSNIVAEIIAVESKLNRFRKQKIHSLLQLCPFTLLEDSRLLFFDYELPTPHAMHGLNAPLCDSILAHANSLIVALSRVLGVAVPTHLSFERLTTAWLPLSTSQNDSASHEVSMSPMDSVGSNQDLSGSCREGGEADGDTKMISNSEELLAKESLLQSQLEHLFYAFGMNSRSLINACPFRALVQFLKYCCSERSNIGRARQGEEEESALHIRQPDASVSQSISNFIQIEEYNPNKVSLEAEEDLETSSMEKSITVSNKSNTNSGTTELLEPEEGNNIESDGQLDGDEWVEL